MAKENKDLWGAIVRDAWVTWAKEQPNPKSSWLLPWEELSDIDKESDRKIAESLITVYSRFMNKDPRFPDFEENLHKLRLLLGGDRVPMTEVRSFATQQIRASSLTPTAVFQYLSYQANIGVLVYDENLGLIAYKFGDRLLSPDEATAIATILTYHPTLAAGTAKEIADNIQQYNQHLTSPWWLRLWHRITRKLS